MTLDDDLRLEISARTEAPIFMRRPRVTICARMKTPAVWIDTPAKRQIRAVIAAQNFSRRVIVELEPRR